MESYTLTEIAKKLDRRHIKLVGVVNNIVDNLNDSHYKNTFNFERVELEYRGQKYISYILNKSAYLLLISKLKTTLAIKTIGSLITSDSYNEDMLDTVTKSYSELQKEVEELRIFKAIYLENSKNKDRSTIENSEYLMHQDIILNFKAYFPDLVYIESEKHLPDGDRIDIFAKDKETGIPVIMELKHKSVSAHQQLRNYAYIYYSQINGLSQPKLINVTKYPVLKNKQVSGIEYYSLQKLKT